VSNKSSMLFKSMFVCFPTHLLVTDLVQLRTKFATSNMDRRDMLVTTNVRRLCLFVINKLDPLLIWPIK
jgi:hypothetical protein